MKQYISRFLKSLAGIFMVFPVLYLLIAATFFDIPMDQCLGLLLSPFYYLVVLLVMLTGYGFWEMRRWSWYVFLLSQALLTYENAVLLQRFSDSHNKVLVFVLATLLQLVLLYRVSREILVPYFFPKIRWWESNPRYRMAVPVRLRKVAGQELEGTILDVSHLGCFVKLQGGVTEGEKLEAEFSIYGFEIRSDGTAVWSAPSTVTHPQGIGFKFNPLSRGQKKLLRQMQRRNRKIKTLYRKFRFLLSQDEFLKKLEELEAGKPLKVDLPRNSGRH